MSYLTEEEEQALRDLDVVWLRLESDFHRLDDREAHFRHVQAMYDEECFLNDELAYIQDNL